VGFVRLVHVLWDLWGLVSSAPVELRDAVVARRGPKSLDLARESRNRVTRSQLVTRWKCLEISGLRKTEIFPVSRHLSVGGRHQTTSSISCSSKMMPFRSANYVALGHPSVKACHPPKQPWIGRGRIRKSQWFMLLT
jgi:hypothetical protein